TAYMLIATPHCLRLLAHCALRALALARDNAGSNIDAKMAIIAITTSNSINVKPRPGRRRGEENSALIGSAAVRPRATLAAAPASNTSPPFRDHCPASKLGALVAAGSLSFFFKPPALPEVADSNFASAATLLRIVCLN